MTDIKCAALHIAKLKNWLDQRFPEPNALDLYAFKKLLEKNILRRGWNDRKPTESCVLQGDNFVRLVLPFSCPETGESPQLIDVPPELVLGGAYYGLPQPKTHQDAAEIANILDMHSETEGTERAIYSQIGDFPLYVAGEGKNRVSLYRWLGRPIKAQVSRSPYPDACSLLLRPVKPWGGFALECLDKNAVLETSLYRGGELLVCMYKPNIAMLNYDESVAFYHAYGVSEGVSVTIMDAPYRRAMLQAMLVRRKYSR